VRVDTCDGKNIRDFYRVVLPGCQFEFWPKYFRVCCLWAGLGAYNFAVHQEVIDFPFFVAEFIDKLKNSIPIRWRRFWYGSDALQLVPWNELSLETRQVCEQFRKHHLENCHKAIARNRR
jgi:hypothetical protein